MLPSRSTERVGARLVRFLELNTQPTDTSVYASPAASRRPAQDSRPRWSRSSFLVGLLHPLPYAGLSRRTSAPDTPPLRLSAVFGDHLNLFSACAGAAHEGTPHPSLDGW